MKTHQKFLEFNNNKILFLNADGVYWVALKPILAVLNLESDRYLKRTKRDHFFGRRLDTMSIQVEKNGKVQGRNMVCLPEKYIYGWICILNADNKELEEYKDTCYSLLFDHFHGTITNRKELLLERTKIDTEIHEVKQALHEEDLKYKKLKELENKRKSLSKQLNSIDNELINQPNLFKDEE